MPKIYTRLEELRVLLHPDENELYYCLISKQAWQELAVERKLLLYLISKALECSANMNKELLDKKLADIISLNEIINEHLLKEDDLASDDLILLGEKIKKFKVSIDKLQLYFYQKIITSNRFTKENLDELNSEEISVGDISLLPCEKKWYKNQLPSRSLNIWCSCFSNYSAVQEVDFKDLEIYSWHKELNSFEDAMLDQRLQATITDLEAFYLFKIEKDSDMDMTNRMEKLYELPHDELLKQLPSVGGSDPLATNGEADYDQNLIRKINNLKKT